jgi:hypothetical protein
VFSLCAAAGEAGGSFVPVVRRRSSLRGARGKALDPERSRQEAGRRAARELRRYCVANGLDRLGTLTYSGIGVHDPRQVRGDVGRFFRHLRRGLGVGAFAYVWVPEWHKTGHGLHLHFAVGRYVPRSLIEESWGHGFVHIKRLTDMPVGSTAKDRGRRAAGYLSKYVSKGFTDGTGGLHRYEVAQGFKPLVTRCEGVSVDDGLDQMNARMGSAPIHRWSSLEVEGWDRPPAVSFRWRC